MINQTTYVIGASRGPGRLLFDTLHDTGATVVGIARSKRDITKLLDNAQFIEFDANNTARLNQTIAPNSIVIHASRPDILTQLLAKAPSIDRLVALGSTRIFTRYPDQKCRALQRMATAIWASGIAATLLHPTLIYHAPGLNNIERVMAIAKRSPFIPLPINGDALIQPIHAMDVVEAIFASLRNPETIGRTMTIAGPQAMSYRTFVDHCIRHAKTKCRIVSVPFPLIKSLAPLTNLIPAVPTITTDEIQRLLEDKDFDISDMTRLLEFSPRSFEQGLAEPPGLKILQPNST